MWSRAKAFGLAAVVVAAALVPLYGDPRSAPVTHAEWARMLLRALQMGDVLEVSGQASQAFTILSWKSSLAFPAEHYLRASGVEPVGEGPSRQLVAVRGEGDVVYPLAVARGGSYTLRMQMSGNPAAPVRAQITAMGATEPVKEFAVTPSSIAGWVDAGALHLDPGAYTTSLLLPQGTSLESVEVRPPCLAPIEPPGGWRATAVVQTTDLAVTAVKAMDAESELPPAAPAIEVTGSAFQTTGGSGAITLASSPTGQEGLWLKAGPSGLQAVVFVDLPEPGLYSVSTLGIEGGGQSWLADSCQKAVVCASLGEAPKEQAPAWRTLMTTTFGGGRHFFTVTLGSGAAVARLRLERKRESPADYVETLRRLGLDPGPQGPVTRDKAVEAMKFVQGRRSDTFTKPCGDPLATTGVVAAGLTGAAPAGPVLGPGVTPLGTGPAQTPVGPVAVPPQLPGSPVTPGP